MTDKRPPLLLIKTRDGFAPYDRLSAQIMGDAVIGQVFSCTPRKGRNGERHRAYWAGLNVAIKATEAWPTAQHLHDDLKRLCGYVTTYHNPLTGQDEIRVQSTAFDKMTESEFVAFFNFARQRFIEKMGFDPWAQDEFNG